MKDVTHSIKNNRLFKRTKKSRLVLYIIWLIIMLVYYYIMLPPIHYASLEFWSFALIGLVGLILFESIADGMDEVKYDVIIRSKKYRRLLMIPLAVLVIGGLSYSILSPVFFSKQYSQMIQVTQKDFQKDFKESNVHEIPLIDRDTAQRLGDRKLGALTDLVSQFVAASDYTQINISSQPYRVTPLEYAGFFKWVNNFRTGLPHYLKVDMVSGDVTVETPKEPIKYSYSDKFFRYVPRKLRFNYPFYIFGEPSFEVDDEGNPYYIATTYTRNFFIREPEANGVVVLNAMTGETQLYSLDEIPTWIDRVHSAPLIMHQLEMRGKYINGFWNALFAKRGVTEPTQGYNYLPLEDDIYLYTGITSVVSDESNIGFVLVNMRTKEATIYPVTAAEEFSAMRSAEGSVQEKGYEATFPLLLNINGQPMYILSLKDSAGLIKAFALIDVQNYQKVWIDTSVDRLIQQYSDALGTQLDDIEELPSEAIKGKIQSIQATVVDGDTVYYFMVDGKIYKANIKLNDQLPFVKEGTIVKFDAVSNGAVQTFEVEED
ncbi:hypothetical protein CJ205_03385 [Dolosicoccus paucivorans]|uniref:CvpA family protein n=1 Tax=Dolosicoccus paucivorans TaxID=84521 RepID=A0A2N6SNI3_9LACT|nr:hypothetical protein [Dolosicoccus paucivorans]PMB83723.1 hypothetical protein CJ206_07555 [Dolosicoccus paucivorans]PMC58637.1 hypothetical protein CJ205_03385 [Dolosicoccus paucivorans]